jgi:hypothetical protein
LLRCVHLLKSAVPEAGTRRFKDALHRDIDLIQEIREMVFYAIENPSLPFDQPPDFPARELSNKSKKSVQPILGQTDEQLTEMFSAALSSLLAYKEVTKKAGKPKFDQIEVEPNGAF